MMVGVMNDVHLCVARERTIPDVQLPGSSACCHLLNIISLSYL